MGVCAMNSGRLDGLPCYECEFETRTVGPNETARMIAHIMKSWLHLPPKKKVVIRVLARLR